MKLDIKTDFTKFPRAVAVIPTAEAGSSAPWGRVALAHDERRLRRRAVDLDNGEKILVDLTEPANLADGDRLTLEDGRQVEVVAAAEPLYEVRPRDPAHLAELTWHLGNRHIAIAVAVDHVLILPDHVVKTLLDGLGAIVKEVSEPFRPLPKAHFGHDHDHHDHDHQHGHPEHDHHGPHHHGHDERGGRDRYGRLPGDPHYGHNHA
jgi:urease accessory protein